MEPTETNVKTGLLRLNVENFLRKRQDPLLYYYGKIYLPPPFLPQLLPDSLRGRGLEPNVGVSNLGGPVAYTYTLYDLGLGDQSLHTLYFWPGVPVLPSPRVVRTQTPLPRAHNATRPYIFIVTC